MLLLVKIAPLLIVVFVCWLVFMIATLKNLRIFDGYTVVQFFVLLPIAYFVWTIIAPHEPWNLEEWFVLCLVFIVIVLCPVSDHMLSRYRALTEDMKAKRRARIFVGFTLASAILICLLGAQGVRTPTALAVKEYPFLAKPLIYGGIGINERNNQWEAPLGIALEQGKLELARLLISKGADVNAKNLDSGGKPVKIYRQKPFAGTKTISLPEDTLLMLASNRGNLEAMKLLLGNGANVNAKTSQGQTALMSASETGKVDAVDILLAQGADIQAEDASGKTALVYAAGRGTLETVKDLLSKGIRFSPADKNNAFIEAVRWYQSSYKLWQIESSNKIQYLMDAGADINARDETGSTPLLHAAAINGTSDLSKMLIDHGADIHAKNNKGTTVLMQASAAYKPDIAKLLVEMGAAVNARDDEGRTPLMWMVSTTMDNNTKMLILLDAGADINVRDNQGGTPLMLAAQHGGGRRLKMNLLLDRGAAINVQDKYGKTPLMYAAWGGPPEIILRMLEMGANPNVLDKGRRSALDYALECDKKYNIPEFKKTIEYLKQYGAK